MNDKTRHERLHPAQQLRRPHPVARRRQARRGRARPLHRRLLAAAHAACRVRAQPASPTPGSLSIDTSEAKRQPGVALVMTGRGAGQALHGPVGRHAHLLSRHEVGAAISAWPWTGPAGPASRWRWSWRARAPRPRTPPSACRSNGRSCRPSRTRRPRSLPARRRIHAELGDNLAFRKAIDTGNVEAAFAKADLVIEDTFEFGRHTAVSLESRARARRTTTRPRASSPSPPAASART